MRKTTLILGLILWWSLIALSLAQDAEMETASSPYSARVNNDHHSISYVDAKQNQEIDDLKIEMKDLKDAIIAKIDSIKESLYASQTNSLDSIIKVLAGILTTLGFGYGLQQKKKVSSNSSEDLIKKVVTELKLLQGSN